MFTRAPNHVAWRTIGRRRRITTALKISPKALETHIGTIYSKLGLEPAMGERRRVLVVLNYMRQR